MAWAPAKGARNREKRKKAREAAQNSPETLVEQLLEVDSRNRFMRLLNDQPVVLEDPVLELLEEKQEIVGYGPIFAAWRQLLLTARTDPAAAWSEFEDRMAAASEIGKRLEEDHRNIEGALAEHRYDAESHSLTKPCRAPTLLDLDLGPAPYWDFVRRRLFRRQRGTVRKILTPQSRD